MNLRLDERGQGIARIRLVIGLVAMIRRGHTAGVRRRHEHVAAKFRHRDRSDERTRGFAVALLRIGVDREAHAVAIFGRECQQLVAHEAARGRSVDGLHGDSVPPLVVDAKHGVRRGSPGRRRKPMRVNNSAYRVAARTTAVWSRPMTPR